MGLARSLNAGIDYFFGGTETKLLHGISTHSLRDRLLQHSEIAAA